jgi:hypothetical protein
LPSFLILSLILLWLWSLPSICSVSPLFIVHKYHHVLDHLSKGDWLTFAFALPFAFDFAFAFFFFGSSSSSLPPLADYHSIHLS